MRTQDFQGLKIYRMPADAKRTRKDGTPRDPKKLGKIHFPVFTPDGSRVVGFMVSPPDVAGMIKQQDRFIARDALRVYEGVFAVRDERDSYDTAAARRLGIDLDACIIWTGMDAVTVSGEKLGYCTDAEFDLKTGAVSSYSLTSGAAASALLGTIDMPASYLKGYADGAMVVSDEAASIRLSGGVAAKAGAASAKVEAKVRKGVDTLDTKGAEAIKRVNPALEKGGRALGKQIGKTRGMFSSFASEFKKASSSSPSKAKKSKSK